MTGYIVLAIAVVLVLWGVGTFNGLVRRRNMVAEGWSGIEAQLKRRADLIPNLVETVKGYAAHERGTLDELTKLRASAQQAPSGDVQARAETERQIATIYEERNQYRVILEVDPLFQRVKSGVLHALGFRNLTLTRDQQY